MFARLERLNSSTLGLISGLMIGIIIVSLYFIYTFNFGLFQFLPPIILAIVAGFLMFVHVLYRFPSTISNFISGIIIVIAALFIFIDFHDQVYTLAGQALTLFAILLTVISFFSVVFLMKAKEIRMLTEPQKEVPVKKEMPLDIERKQKEKPRPPMDRL